MNDKVVVFEQWERDGIGAPMRLSRRWCVSDGVRHYLPTCMPGAPPAGYFWPADPPYWWDHFWPDDTIGPL